ncbi:MAG: spermidine/putrescine import ATP-binding protein PotA [Ignavibacteriaceae bacterium]|nr:MAG: ABC transporter ATP-binding protein [Chlorobiota bacterium]GJQ32446.1 MAG: spermidine/putrescine import ATP-binding protein PotA [Ignavibacteriaceae bacterium]
MLELKEIRKSFGKTPVVDGISLVIGEGEFFCLLGPSGCGKTTLLRIIAGFESPDSGSVIFNGKEITELPAYKRDFNLIFQNFALFPHLSVYENIAFGLKVKGIGKEETESRVAGVISSLGLDGLGKRMPSALSGGQQQRVAVARAIVNRPKLLLLDEPLSSLDKKIAEKTLIELTDLQKKLGITFIYVTHNQDEALSLADRIALMNGGKIVQLDSPENLYERPANRFAAGFIGKMNFIPCEVTTVEGELHNIRLKDGKIIQFISSKQFPVGNHLHFTVRPENITISAGPHRNGHNFITGTLRHKIYMGDYYEFEFTLQEGNIFRVQANKTTDNSFFHSLSVGEVYYLSWEKTSGWPVVEEQA